MDDEQVAHETDVVRLDFPDCDIWIRASSPAEKNWRARSCAKEPWTIEWLRGAVRPGEVLYDIGANVGTFALVAAKAITLDAITATFQLRQPHHLKIDVDGAEARVLARAPETLRSETLRTVLIEVDGVQWTGVSSLLERAGFILDKRIERRKPDAPEYGLFVRRPAFHRPSRLWTFLRNASRQ